MQKDFYINDQFLVKPGTNLLIDGLVSRISKVDPGIMRLLCMLAEHNGKMVLKEELMAAVWHDNSGSEETLDHAITTLRKLLQDEKKNTIRQVARKGYSFHASITNADIDDLTKDATAVNISRVPATTAQKWILALSILIVLLLVIFALYNYTYSDETPAQPANDHTVSDQRPATADNETNTIVSLGPDSVIYKLVMTDDEPSRFFIDGRELNADDWEPYQPLINSLRRQWKQKQEED